MAIPICPKCEAQIESVDVRPLDLKDGGGEAWKGVSYYCPHCLVLLGVAIDPLALRADIVAKVHRQVSILLEDFRKDFQTDPIDIPLAHMKRFLSIVHGAILLYTGIAVPILPRRRN